MASRIEFNSLSENYPILDKVSKTVILEAIVGLIITGVGLYLANYYGVNTTYILIGGIAGVSLTGLVIIATARCATHKKLSSGRVESTKEISKTEAILNFKPKKVIQGEVRVNPRGDGGPIGDKELRCDQNKLFRTDGVDWTKKHNEFMLECIVTVEEQEHSLRLPFCLFIHNDDYTSWKKEGDKIEYYYGENKYELTISKDTVSFRSAVETLTMKYQSRPYSINFNPEKEDPTKEKTYIHPMIEQLEAEAKKKALDNRAITAQAMELFSIPHDEETLEPPYGMTPHTLEIDMPGVKNVASNSTDGFFVVYGKREGNPSSLLVIPFTEIFTKEKVKNCTTSMNKNGVVTIQFGN